MGPGTAGEALGGVAAPRRCHHATAWAVRAREGTNPCGWPRASVAKGLLKGLVDMLAHLVVAVAHARAREGVAPRGAGGRHGPVALARVGGRGQYHEEGVEHAHHSRRGVPARRSF